MNPSERIDQLIAGLTDWRGKTLASIRKSILEADQEIIEEWKWMGSPVWSHDGMIAARSALDRGSPSTMWRSNSITDTPSTSRLVIFNATLFPPHREIVPRRPIPELLGLPTTARTKTAISTAAWGARPVPRDRA